MTLSDYLTEKGISTTAMAQLLDVEPETVRRYKVGLRRPTRSMMGKINAVTRGAVTANDFDLVAAPADGGGGQNA